MVDIFRNNKGQLAPFFLIVIAILIVAIMVTANIGKIGIYRVNTANASDSGALAGSTVMANTFSQVQIISDNMYFEALVAIAILCVGRYVPFLWPLAVAYYVAFMIAQNYRFWTAENIVDDARDEAPKSIRQLAFMNAGVDEVKPREGSESYEEWQKRESNFGQWMKDKTYERESIYSWDNDQDGNSSSVTVSNISIPDYELIDMSERRTIYGWVLRRHGRRYLRSAPRMFLMYIDRVRHESQPITVTVTRFDPDKNLGFWTLRFGSISSSSGSRVCDGSVRPSMLGGEPYDSRLSIAR